MFEVKHSNQSEKFLKKADKILFERLINKIDGLKLIPITRDTKVIEGFDEKLFRVRVGDYRILYEIDYTLNIIGIVRIDKRSKVYD